MLPTLVWGRTPSPSGPGLEGSRGVSPLLAPSPGRTGGRRVLRTPWLDCAAHAPPYLRRDHDCDLLHPATVGLQPEGIDEWLQRAQFARTGLGRLFLQLALLLRCARHAAVRVGRLLVGAPLKIWAWAPGDP